MSSEYEHYLAQHNIAELLEGVVVELLDKKPSKPRKFIIEYLRNNKSRTKSKRSKPKVKKRAAKPVPQSRQKSFFESTPPDTQSPPEEEDSIYANLTSFNMKNKTDIKGDRKRSAAEYEDITLNDHEIRRKSYHDICKQRYGGRGRRSSVTSERLDPSKFKNYKPKVHKKTETKTREIQECLKDNILFKELSEKNKRVLLDSFERFEFRQDQTLIKQGEDGKLADKFYVLLHGVCNIYVRPKDAPPPRPNSRLTQYENEAERIKDQYGTLVCVCKKGDTFGELALLYDSPRAATVIAATHKVVTYAIDRVTFKMTIAKRTTSKREKYKKFLSNVPILSTLDEYEKGKLADSLEECSYELGAYIIKQGESGSTFFMIKKGDVRVTKEVDGSEKDVGELKKGSYFGELALMYDGRRNASIIANSDHVVCVTLRRARFMDIIGKLEDKLQRNTALYKEYTAKLKNNQQ